MEKIYCFNTESCTYEEVEKPFMMHNLLVLTLMFTSMVFFLLTCYYHAENEKTMELAPDIARNCYSEVESLKMELYRQKQNLQVINNEKYLMKNAVIGYDFPLLLKPVVPENKHSFEQDQNLMVMK